MDWIEAFLRVNKYLNQVSDGDVVEAWQVLTQAPPPYGWGKPPLPHSGSEGGLPENIYQFLETGRDWRRRNDVGRLLFRLVKAVEGLPELLGVDMSQGSNSAQYQVPMRSPPSATACSMCGGKRARVDCGRCVVCQEKTADDVYQSAYCDDCGMELDIDGRCHQCSQ